MIEILKLSQIRHIMLPESIESKIKKKKYQRRRKKGNKN